MKKNKKVNVFTFRKYYGWIKFNLSKEENKQLYDYSLFEKEYYDFNSLEISDQDIQDENKASKYLTIFEPHEHFSIIIKTILSFKRDNNFYDNMIKYTNGLDLIFILDFEKEIICPTYEYPNYSYNYLFWKFLQIIKRFEKKRKIQPSKFILIKNDQNINQLNDNIFYDSDCYGDENKLEEYSNSDEKKKNYGRLIHFLKTFEDTMGNFSSKDHKSNLIKIKIFLLYFHLFENNSFSKDIIQSFLSILDYFKAPEITPK